MYKWPIISFSYIMEQFHYLDQNKAEFVLLLLQLKDITLLKNYT